MFRGDVIKAKELKAKNKVGRPALKEKPKKSRMVYISDEAHEFFTLSGNGNFSKGIHVIFEKLNSLIGK